jgi:predicted phage tail protein
MGRKAGGLGRAATGIGSMSRSSKEKLDVRQAEEALEAVQRQRADLEAEVEQETARVAAEYDPQNWTFETESIRPRSSDTDVKQLALAWIPFAPDSFGALRPAIEI